MNNLYMITHSMTICNDGYLRTDDPTTWDRFVDTMEYYGYIHWIICDGNLILSLDDDDISSLLLNYPNLCEEGNLNFVCLTSDKYLREHSLEAIRTFSYSEGDNQ